MNGFVLLFSTAAITKNHEHPKQLAKYNERPRFGTGSIQRSIRPDGEVSSVEVHRVLPGAVPGWPAGAYLYDGDAWSR